MKRTSKYLGKTFDNGWICTHIGIATMVGKKYKYKSGNTKRPGHQNYYYIFERVTSDGKAEKMIRLTSYQAAQVYKGLLKVEDIANQKAEKASKNFVSKVSYSFYKETN